MSAFDPFRKFAAGQSSTKADKLATSCALGERSTAQGHACAAAVAGVIRSRGRGGGTAARRRGSDMAHSPSYDAVLATSLKAAWQLDDVLAPGQELDFSRNFLPDSLVRTAELTSLTADEQRALNHINAHEYLRLFVIVEEFIIPALLDHSRTMLRRDPAALRAILNFAGEEAKHIHLFERFEQAFIRQFPVRCEMIGPSEAIGAEVLRHRPLAVGLTVLMIEWMTQVHYVDSVRGDVDIDPLFKTMLKHHWIEEAQHAKLDRLLIDELAEDLSDDELDASIDDFLEIVEFLDRGLQAQAGLNLDALERLTGRTIEDRQAIQAQQHQAARWTYLGSGIAHRTFVATLEDISPRGARRVAEAARVLHRQA